MQHTLSDGQATTSVMEEAKHTQSLSCLSSYLVDVCHRGQPHIIGHPKITCCFDPLYWLNKKLDWSGLLDVSRSFSKKHHSAL
jgi:hypothetical protein